MIDDKYIHDNMDEIVIFMIKIMPEKAINASNWRRNMKKEGVSKSISYVGFALAYKNDKKINSYGDRIDRFYDKEAILDEKIENQKPIIDKLENHIKTARNIIRDLQDTIQERFEGERDDAIFDRDDITSELSSRYGGFLL